MLKKTGVLIFCGMLLLGIYGCIALFAGGAAGGAGTAVWLSGKLTQEVNAPFEKTIGAVKSALDSLELGITKRTEEENVVQIKSEYTDGKTIWIDVRRISEESSKIEVRVGAVTPDKQAADKILKRIQKYL